MTILPLFGNVLIRPIITKRKSKQGIELPDTMQQEGNTITGNVIAAGSGSLAFDGSLIKMEVHPGEIVLFKKYEAEKVIIEEESLYLVDQRQIMGIFSSQEKDL